MFKIHRILTHIVSHARNAFGYYSSLGTFGPWHEDILYSVARHELSEFEHSHTVCYYWAMGATPGSERGKRPSAPQGHWQSRCPATHNSISTQAFARIHFQRVAFSIWYCDRAARLTLSRWQLIFSQSRRFEQMLRLNCQYASESIAFLGWYLVAICDDAHFSYRLCIAKCKV